MVVKGYKIRYKLVPQSHYCVCMCIWANHGPLRASQVILVVKNPSANAEDRCRFDPWVGRCPGGGQGDPLHYSCLENPLDRGAWWAAVHRVAKSWTELKRLSTHACVCMYNMLIYTYIYFNIMCACTYTYIFMYIYTYFSYIYIKYIRMYMCVYPGVCIMWVCVYNLLSLHESETRL